MGEVVSLPSLPPSSSSRSVTCTSPPSSPQPAASGHRPMGVDPGGEGRVQH